MGWFQNRTHLRVLKSPCTASPHVLWVSPEHSAFCVMRFLTLGNRTPISSIPVTKQGSTWPFLTQWQKWHSFIFTVHYWIKQIQKPALIQKEGTYNSTSKWEIKNLCPCFEIATAGTQEYFKCPDIFVFTCEINFKCERIPPKFNNSKNVFAITNNNKLKFIIKISKSMINHWK